MTNLFKSIAYLTKSLKDEHDTRIQEALAIMLNVYDSRRECECGNRHERLCDKCKETLLCDDCDKGTHHDECSVCQTCKNNQEESYWDLY